LSRTPARHARGIQIDGFHSLFWVDLKQKEKK
jgi:hypothetical protein